MGEGEDERPENFDQILEMTGLDPEQVRKYSVNWAVKMSKKATVLAFQRLCN